MSRDPLCSFQTEDGLLVEGDGVNVLGNCERRGLREQLRALAHRDADQKHGAARLAQGRFERHRSGRHGLPGLAADEQEHALGVGAEEALLPLVWLHVHAAHEGCGRMRGRRLRPECGAPEGAEQSGVGDCHEASSGSVACREQRG